MSNYYEAAEDAVLSAAPTGVVVVRKPAPGLIVAATRGGPQSRMAAARLQRLAAVAAQSARVAKAFRYAANRPKSRGKVQQILQLLRDWGLPGEDLRRALPRWEQKAAADYRALVLAKKAARRGLSAYEPDDEVMGAVSFGPPRSEGLLRAQEQADRAEAIAVQTAANDAATAAQADTRAQAAYDLMSRSPAERARIREQAAKAEAERRKAEQAAALAQQAALVLQQAAARRAAEQAAAERAAAAQRAATQVVVVRAAAGAPQTAAERRNLEVARVEVQRAERRVAARQAEERRAAALAAEAARKAEARRLAAQRAAEKRAEAQRKAEQRAAARAQQIAAQRAAKQIAALRAAEQRAAARRAAAAARGVVVVAPPPARGTVVVAPPPARGTVVVAPPPAPPTSVVVKPSGVVVTPRGTVVATPPPAAPFASIANLATSAINAGANTRKSDAMIAAIRGQIASGAMHHDLRDIVARLRAHGVQRGSHRPLANYFRGMAARESGDRQLYFATLSAYLG